MHTALSYGPVRLFNKSVTNWLLLYWPWNRFSVSSIGPRPSGPILLTSNLYQSQYRHRQLVTLYYKNKGSSPSDIDNLYTILLSCLCLIFINLRYCIMDNIFNLFCILHLIYKEINLE